LRHGKRTGRIFGRSARVALAATIVAVCCAACHSPAESQKYFATAAAQDPMLELLHETPLYSVYFDHALRRCVLHSAHTWGENGGGGGGTGIGVALFPCDPVRLKARAAELRSAIEAGRIPVLPAAAPVESAPSPPTQKGDEDAAKGSPPPGSYPGSAH
jgi:hypothetical protein